MARFWEIDAVRGLAIVGMIIFHFAFDLNFLDMFSLSLYSGQWLIFQRAVITTFLVLVGVSLHLSYTHLLVQSSRAVFKKFLSRSAGIAGAAALVSIGTWIVVPSGFVIFGVLHLIALATLAALPFLRFHRLNLVLGLLLIAQGLWFPLPEIASPWLLWLGFSYPGFYSVDYVPLVPWFGLVLIGLFIGRSLYPNGERTYPVPISSNQSNLLSRIGQHSLIIYLVHQPILLALLELYLLLVHRI